MSKVVPPRYRIERFGKLSHYRVMIRSENAPYEYESYKRKRLRLPSSQTARTYYWMTKWGAKRWIKQQEKERLDTSEWTVVEEI